MWATPVDDVLDAPSTRSHLERLVRVWLGVPDRDVAMPRLPRELARLVLRLEEHERNERDPWGAWSVESSDNFRRGALREPEIDIWLERARLQLPAETHCEPRWPEGRRFVVCLTHDVDVLSVESTPMQAFRYTRAGFAPGAAGKGDAIVRLARPAVRGARMLRAGITRRPSLVNTLERSIDLEQAHDATASYFFTVPPHAPRSRYDCVYAPQDRCLFRGREHRVVDVIRAIADAGFDVGLHGGYAAASVPGALAEERATLERATRLDIRTTRQHFLRWDVRWT